MQEYEKALESYQDALESLENSVNEMTEKNRMELYRVLSNKGQTWERFMLHALSTM